jgi:hypothetical protein
MSTAHATTIPQQERLWSRLREIAVGAAFALVLLIPKILRVRENPASWLAFRVVLGFAGAALVVLPLGIWNNWLVAPAGLCLFLASILLPPAKTHLSVDDKLRELGALVVVNGGNYSSNQGKPVAVHVFVAPDQISVLDPALQQLLIIPAAEIASVVATPAENAWMLRIVWPGGAAEFFYQGFFAEHLARVAQTTVRSVVPAPLPILQKTRAASA